MLNDSDRSHVYLTKVRDGRSQIIVDQQIVEWKRAGEYILVLRKVASSPDCLLKNGQVAIITHYTSDEEYWMINPRSDEIIGPLSKGVFEVRKKMLGFGDVELITPITYHDNSKEFQNIAGNCHLTKR